jgi:two-component system, NarL family, invasion response regulator UvrY
MLKILLVDDHALVRKGVARILEQDVELQVRCEEAAQAQDARRLLAQGHFDLVILDISLPGGNGLDLLKTLHRDYPRLPIMMLSMYPEDQYAIRAFTLGARGYVCKECAPEHLLTAVRKVLTGGRYLSPQLAERLAGHLASGSGNGPASHQDLTDREFSVLRLIGAGSSPAQAAAQLFLSVKTVNTHRARIMRKLGLKSNAELINYAIRNHLSD